MSYRSYHFNILWRVILLAAIMMAFFYALNQDEWYVTASISGLLIPVTVLSLFRYTHRFRNELSTFISAVKSKEYSHYIKDDTPLSISELDYAFHAISKEFQNIGIEKEQHYHYLQTIVENINTGIISYKESGEIHLFNKAAKNLLDCILPTNIQMLKSYQPKIYNALVEMKPGDRRVINIKSTNRNRNLAIQAKEFRKSNEVFKLYSLQDISSELDTQELESYQKLIKVLRHEIMNSATPISSLSEAVYETIKEMTRNPNLTQKELYDELEDLRISTQTIHTRTKGLLNFVQNYRKLTNIPAPSFANNDLREIVDHTLQLLKSEISGQSVKINVELDSDLQIYCDFDQIQQVFINVLLNAIQALKENNSGEGRIDIYSHDYSTDSCSLKIIDNGRGMNKDELEKIFVPFYTTKKQGSGIGLSVSRQIMKLNNGSIHIDSEKDVGTSCELLFMKNFSS